MSSGDTEEQLPLANAGAESGNHRKKKRGTLQPMFAGNPPMVEEDDLDDAGQGTHSQSFSARNGNTDLSIRDPNNTSGSRTAADPVDVIANSITASVRASRQRAQTPETPKLTAWVMPEDHLSPSADPRDAQREKLAVRSLLSEVSSRDHSSISNNSAMLNFHGTALVEIISAKIQSVVDHVDSLAMKSLERHEEVIKRIAQLEKSAATSGEETKAALKDLKQQIEEQENKVQKISSPIGSANNTALRPMSSLLSAHSQALPDPERVASPNAEQMPRSASRNASFNMAQSGSFRPQQQPDSSQPMGGSTNQSGGNPLKHGAQSAVMKRVYAPKATVPSPESSLVVTDSSRGLTPYLRAKSVAKRVRMMSVTKRAFESSGRNKHPMSKGPESPWRKFDPSLGAGGDAAKSPFGDELFSAGDETEQHPIISTEDLADGTLNSAGSNGSPSPIETPSDNASGTDILSEATSSGRRKSDGSGPIVVDARKRSPGGTHHGSPPRRQDLGGFAAPTAKAAAAALSAGRADDQENSSTSKRSHPWGDRTKGRRKSLAQARKQSNSSRADDFEMDSRRGSTGFGNNIDGVAGGGQQVTFAEPSANKTTEQPLAANSDEPSSNDQSMRPSREITESRRSMRTGSSKRKKTTVDRLNSTLHPESGLVNVFDFMYIATTVTSIIMCIALVHPQNEYDLRGGLPIFYPIWIACQALYTAAFMLLQTRIRCRRAKNSWVLVDDPREIRNLYFSRWFAFDLFMTIPIEFIFLGWVSDAAVYIGFRHTLRYIRIVSLSSSPNPVASERTWFRFSVFCGTMVLVAHVAASGFWGVMRGYDITYIDSLYWSVATMTSVGYGDISPVEQGQRVYAICCMLSGVLLISSFTAFATQYLTQKDAITEESDKNKMMMKALLEHYQVPWKVAREVIAVFPSLLNNNLSAHFRSQIDGLPPFLRDQLQQYVNAAQLRQIPMFAVVSNDMLFKIGGRMHTTFVPAYEYIMYEDDESDALYVILRGVVEVSMVDGDTETVVATLREGEYFGEMGLISNSNRSANVMAVVSTELLVLDKDDFTTLLNDSEILRNAVFKEFRERHGSLLARTMTMTGSDNPLRPPTNVGEGNEDDSEIFSAKAKEDLLGGLGDFTNTVSGEFNPEE